MASNNNWRSLFVLGFFCCAALSTYLPAVSSFIVPASQTHQHQRHHHHQQQQHHFTHSTAKIISHATFSTNLMSTKDSNRSEQEQDAAYEADRLAKDAQAMTAMKETSEAEFAKLRTPWKWVIRKRIWDLLEGKDIARPPRPVHHRIPNFDGAEQAATRLASLDCFQNANMVKVNPDTPQKPVRQLVLQTGKTLLTPQPRLRTGFFSIVAKDMLPSSVRIEECTTSRGVAKHGTPIGLDEDYQVDLVVVGSTAVCPTTGARVGKGEGFAELEWGILSLQGNLMANETLVVTTVHDEQVVTDMPAGSLTKHDVPVDIIVTPTRTIYVSNRVPKPSGVFWDLLSPQKLAQIKVLRQLKQDIETRNGNVKLPSGPDEVLPPTAQRNRKSNNSGGGNNGKNGKKRNNRRRPNNNNKNKNGGSGANKDNTTDKSQSSPTKASENT